ncbi:hypothetical protein BCR16_12755 [Ralstonia solanacearum FJAT-1458]|nr:hypothetical protein BCR16_12755 [Ralstonia solanacearum FJAT-1458]
MRRLVLTLAVVLAGCAAAPPVHVVTVITPPDSLLQDCSHAPRPADNTVNGLMLGIVSERAVVESCDWSDKAALRAWKAGVQAAQGTQ